MTVDVVAGTTNATASVVRFFNVCRVNNQVQTFPAGVANVNAHAWACHPSFARTVIAGLHSPQGVLVGPDGSVYAIDSGLGGENGPIGNTAQVVRAVPGNPQSLVASLPSLGGGPEGGAVGGGRLAFLGDVLYATNGIWNEQIPFPRPPGMAAVMRIAGGSAIEVANTWDIENTLNPDGFIKDAHPYGIVAGPDGMLYVAEAASNDVLRVNPANGQVSLVAVIPPVPAPFPNPERGGRMEADSVPTGITLGADGNLYVSLLPGAFLPGEAKVVRVTLGGAVSDYATGLSALTDVRRGPDGQLYAVSFGEATEQGPVPNSGSIWRIRPGTASELVMGGLSFPVSIDFNAAGDAFVVVNSVGAPGSGEVVHFPRFTAR